MRSAEDAAMYPRLRDLWRKGGVYRQITGTEKNRVYYAHNMSVGECSKREFIEWAKDAEFLGNKGEKSHAL